MSESGQGEDSRLDVELVRRGHFSSRAQARAAIEAGKVVVDGKIAAKPGLVVRTDQTIDAEPAHPWVSRGGVKLAHALDAFGVSPQERACLDVGTSTGGFADVLLSRGARRVVAVDVGRDQLHPKLRADNRVISLEGTDARELTAALLGESPALVVCDASFIGLAKVLGRALSLAAPGADLVALFKPQFEVGPAHVGKGGLVSDGAATDAAANTVEDWLRSQGWAVIAWTPSPITGGDGNQERLLHARRA
jgi:23S rRNA (cytidine1920-2'-O)/16S rRNA (cytidine1409-2'-O)-methyltransferase